MPRRWMLLILPMLIAVGWRVSILGFAEYHARLDPQRALTQHPQHALALVVRAEQFAEAGQWPRAVELARRSIASNPLQARPYRLLARAAEAAGDNKQAYALYRIAARRSPRDAQTRIWLFNHHLAQNQANAAMADLDALLRAKPKLAPALTETIFGMATRAELQAAFAASVQTAPPWRRDVLVWVVRQAPDLEGVARLMQRLRSSSVGVEPDIAHDWIERLIGERRFEQAYLQWVSELAPAPPKVIGNVFNGEFELPLSDYGFNWRVEQVAGVRIDLLPAEGATGMALRLAFDDQRVAFNHLRQLLVLPTGRFQLQGRARLEDLRTVRGLTWTLSCAEDEHPLASSESFRGSSSWISFSVKFEISDTGCRAQWLRLLLPARIASEQRISGHIWFDNLRVTRLPDMHD